ncbi:MAG: hypothetical protein R2837_05115 [Aliarcobacter sp.]|uniref:Uncharacterized protein n=1 Tax=Arcobacter aquimarinus TaxID=1315211 RepID=A0AAE7B3Y5_9BACT|nr:hypothetical protein [Arcobacter aquimarinus]MCB9097090.1 hypothetical protein [Arcobacter sp.]NCB13370.1 hypothetical protein [Erysipelotrichia bacterium]QKE25070.1 hypothetical protein AAQM_0297 [Arcobacter aquimarinus]RXI36477.1 hypothetical protein CP986_02615 [Arcobacter aquimarinus]
MDKEALFQARTNPDFLKYLEETRVNSMKAGDIGLMYETLDSMLILDLDEENIHKLYEQILKTSFENVEKIIGNNEKLKLEGDNLLYVRALFEHAVEKWSYDNFDGAKELFFVIANIIDDEILEKSLNILIVFLSSKIQIDDFYDTRVDLDSNIDDEKYGYFITNFRFDKQEFLNENKNILETEYKNLKHLLGN